jgi:TcpE family
MGRSEERRALMRRSYSYRKMWRYPIKVYSLGKGDRGLVFSKGIEIRQIVVALLLLGILLLFRNTLSSLLPSSLTLAFYTVIPWMTSGLLCRARMDGKRLDRFLTGLLRYTFHKSESYCSGRRVDTNYTDSIRYEPFKS